ncbi:hypothetical protein Y032_0041g399 [Ancylostoma ceylanicum]|nr:hypothetical protein Y032_0041g399 [Ancylostoma ceylanicum]
MDLRRFRTTLDYKLTYRFNDFIDFSQFLPTGRTLFGQRFSLLAFARAWKLKNKADKGNLQLIEQDSRKKKLATELQYGMPKKSNVNAGIPKLTVG